MQITNYARGPRVLNRRIDKDRVEQVVLAPGASTPNDFELVDQNDPVFKGLFDSGELGIDGKRSRDLGEVDKLTKARSENEKARAELAAKEAELATRETELKTQQDTFQRLQREAAMRAGATPGLADPLPPGTDTKGGKESEEALRRAGIDPKAAQESDPAKGGADAEKGVSNQPDPAKSKGQGDKAK